MDCFKNNNDINAPTYVYVYIYIGVIMFRSVFKLKSNRFASYLQKERKKKLKREMKSKKEETTDLPASFFVLVVAAYAVQLSFNFSNPRLESIG